MEHAKTPAIQFGLFVLLIFAFFRPLTVSFHHIGSISILDIFGISVSYLMLVALVINIQRIKISFISLLILIYIFYCIFSFAWGSEYRDLSKTVLPFLPFFLVGSVISDKKQIRLLLATLIIGYSIPVIGSIILILTGQSSVYITGSQLERQIGLSSGAHTLGHIMLFYSFVFALYHALFKNDSRLWRCIMLALLIGSLFCLFKTYTRTVFLGGLIFWFLYLWSWKRWMAFTILVACFVVFFLSHTISDQLIWQKQSWQSQQKTTKNTNDLNTASSGRLEIWEYNMKIFSNLPMTTKLLGVGVGHELDKVPGSYITWAGSHNDYLSLLITLGIFGLALQILLYINLFIGIISSNIFYQIKYLYICFLISVLVMNFVSNSYLQRFQMAQLFWFLIGIYYVLNHAQLDLIADFSN